MHFFLSLSPTDPRTCFYMCRVGFLSRIMFDVYQHLDGKIARIISIYSNADDIKLRRKMHMNKGVALARVYLTDAAFKADEEEINENE
jgi:hypothetical protein